MSLYDIGVGVHYSFTGVYVYHTIAPYSHHKGPFINGESIRGKTTRGDTAERFLFGAVFYSAVLFDFMHLHSHYLSGSLTRQCGTKGILL